MRRALDALYGATGVLAALLMVGTLLMVLASMVDRIVTLPVLRGMDMYAGYCMAGAGFLALAHTLKRGEHIRVTLLLHALKGGRRRALDTFCVLVALGLSAGFAWYSIRLVWDSLQFNDISTGLDATPLWIPQIAMALGASVFFIAFVDECWTVLSGREPHEIPAAAPLHE